MRKSCFGFFSFKQGHRGLSLVEVLVSMAIAAITIGSFTQYAILTAGSRTDVERQKRVKEILLDNLIEIKGNPISGLPPQGHCRIRKYDSLGIFISEVIANDVTLYCGLGAIPANFYFVFAKVLPASSINAVFSVPASMKLPSYSSLIYQVNIQSFHKGNNGALFKDEIFFIKR
jgi:prepilin-type N-terminal cleavage/methylation domain-containing protein